MQITQMFGERRRVVFFPYMFWGSVVSAGIQLHLNVYFLSLKSFPVQLCAILQNGKTQNKQRFKLLYSLTIVFSTTQKIVSEIKWKTILPVDFVGIAQLGEQKS